MTVAQEQATVRQELEIIRKQGKGVLRPEDVVAFARNPDTALHSRFTWDDDKAADEYRLWQARQIIRVCVTVIRDDRPATRAYVSLRDDRQEPGGGYRTIVDVLRNPDRRARLLAEAKDDAARWVAKYESLDELAEAVAAMRKVAKK